MPLEWKRHLSSIGSRLDLFEGMGKNSQKAGFRGVWSGGFNWYSLPRSGRGKRDMQLTCKFRLRDKHCSELNRQARAHV